MNCQSGILSGTSVDSSVPQATMSFTDPNFQMTDCEYIFLISCKYVLTPFAIFNHSLIKLFYVYDI